MKILISSIGSLVGQNLLEVLKNRRDNLLITGTNSIPDAALFDCDRIYLTPESALPPSDYADSLTEIILKEAPDMVIPGRDIDVVILSLLRDKFPEMKHKFLVGRHELAQMMENKLISFEFSKKENVPFAETIPFDPSEKKEEVENFIEKYNTPLIVKPVKGFASRGVSIITSSDQLFSLKPDQPLILQEYLGNAEKVNEFERKLKTDGLPLFYSFEEVKYSIQLFIGREGTLKGQLVTLHKMVKGVSASVELIKDERLEELGYSYYEAFKKNGWYGPVNIQLQKSFRTGEYKAYEFNGRFTGATAARYFLGHDEIGLAFEDAGYGILKKDTRHGSQMLAVKQPFISERPDNHIQALQKAGQWDKEVLSLKNDV